MNLKFKRNYPIVLLLVGILSFLALTMGSQPIIAYTVSAEIIQTGQKSVLRVDVSDEIAQLTGLPAAQTVNTGFLVGDASEGYGAIYNLFNSYEN